MKRLFTLLLFACIYVASGVGVKAADVITEMPCIVVVDDVGTDHVADMAIVAQDNICPDIIKKDLSVITVDALSIYSIASDSASINDPPGNYAGIRFKQIALFNLHQNTAYWHINAPPPYCYLGKHKYYRYSRSYLA